MEFQDARLEGGGASYIDFYLRMSCCFFLLFVLFVFFVQLLAWSNAIMTFFPLISFTGTISFSLQSIWGCPSPFFQD